MKLIDGGGEVDLAVFKDKYLVASSRGKTWYLFDWVTGKCDCPAGQRDVACYHADLVRQYRLEHSIKEKQPRKALRERPAANVKKRRKT